MAGSLTLLARLGRDNAGNTLAIAAASLIPMMALIGGGVDISRAYMAKTQLQSACDAGVLAGRKALSRSGVYGDSERAKANTMFNFNFNGGALSIDSQDVSFVTEDNDDGQVLGTASAEVPTLLMKIFNKDSVDLTVNCMAELQIGNADIMFVLDTTGSMANSINSGEPSKIAGLRDAVRDFHKTINQAVNDNRTRIRYGFVPYSMTVNVKDLVSAGHLNTSAFTSETMYETRVADFQRPVYIAEDPEQVKSGTETYKDTITQSDCNKYGNNTYPSSGKNPVESGGPAPTAIFRTEYNYDSWTKKSGSGNSAKGTCVRRWVQTRVDYETWYGFTRWIYQDHEIDTSSFKGFNQTRAASEAINAIVSKRGDYDMQLLSKMQDGTALNGVIAKDLTRANHTWNGCIEERATVQEDDFDPIPADALDLDFDAEPNDADTRWRPMWAGLTFARENNSDRSYWYNPSNARFYNNSSFSGSTQSLPSVASSNCPAPMQLLRTVELSDDVNNVPGWLNTYLNNLNAEGNTYHDLGMIWAGRLLSPTGLFANNVNLDADKINVSKHVIFMTDGVMEPTTSGYSAYGVERVSNRIAPAGSSSTTLTTYHTRRFSAVCEKLKAQGATVWVIAFGTSMTTSLKNCASNGRAFYSSNTEALRNTFKYIAAQVADLRLGA